MFSATMPAKIQQLAKNILNNPAEVKLAVSKPAEKIRQSAYICYEKQKLQIIEHIFKSGTLQRVILFAGKKTTVKDITTKLIRMKVNCGAMHSDLTQAERDEIMFRFKSGQINVLVATDIVSRGIDIDDIQMVINYDVPHDAEDYVHRVGRTARADNDGCAITLVGEREQRQFAAIERFLEASIAKDTLPAVLGKAPEYNPAEEKNVRKTQGKQTGRKGTHRKSAAGPAQANRGQKTDKSRRRTSHHRSKQKEQ